MASSPKPKAAEDADVIMYMDELPSSNGLAPLSDPLSTDSYDGDPLYPSIVADTAPTSLEVGGIGTGNNSRRPSRLLETDNTNNPRLKYGPEIDDEFGTELVHGRVPISRDYYPGIDDGLLPEPEDEKPSRGPSSPRNQPGFPGFPGVEESTPDMNVYQQKKTIAQGMMDLALISANANQFRYVLQSKSRHPYYYSSLAMIGLSLFLQVIVGIGLLWNSRYNVKVDAQMCKANRANNWTVIGIFLVTILNVFISSFGVVESSEVIFAANPAA